MRGTEEIVYASEHVDGAIEHSNRATEHFGATEHAYPGNRLELIGFKGTGKGNLGVALPVPSPEHLPRC